MEDEEEDTTGETVVVVIGFWWSWRFGSRVRFLCSSMLRPRDGREVRTQRKKRHGKERRQSREDGGWSDAAVHINTITTTSYLVLIRYCAKFTDSGVPAITTCSTIPRYS